MERVWPVVLAAAVFVPLAAGACNSNRAGTPDDAASSPALQSPQEEDVKGVEARLE